MNNYGQGTATQRFKTPLRNRRIHGLHAADSTGSDSASEGNFLYYKGGQEALCRLRDQSLW
jgi:hypothetical protein